MTNPNGIRCERIDGLILTPFDRASLDAIRLYVQGVTGQAEDDDVLIRTALSMAAARVREFQGHLQTTKALDSA